VEEVAREASLDERIDVYSILERRRYPRVVVLAARGNM